MTNKILWLILIFTGGNVPAISQILKYPDTRKTDQTDYYFGTKVKDPYRWLEDDRSEETAAWVKAENDVTQHYLSRIPFRVQVKKRLTTLWNFPKWSSPFRGGSNYFVYTNDGLQNQFVLNILRGNWQNKPEAFLDPNLLSKEGTVNIADVAVSSNGKYLAYSIGRAGSDWNEIHVRNTENGNESNDRVEWVKFSGISWSGNGFYYSRYDAPDSAQVLTGKNEYQKVYYHQVGNPQKYDILVYQDKEHPLRNFFATTTEDEQFLCISGSEGTSGNNLMVKNLRMPDSRLLTLVDNFENDYTVIGTDSVYLLVLTNKDAPKYRLVKINTKDPLEPWVTVIPEKKDVLQEAIIGNNMIIARYMKDARSMLQLYSRKGTYIMEIPLVTLGTVDQMSARDNDENLFYALTTFTSPSTIYRFNLRTKEQSVFYKPTIDFTDSLYETKQVFYQSKDGTKIPMFIVGRKGLVQDGNNPVLMYGYGGFNISKTPECKIEWLLFLENGGILAVPNLRGGGEYGEAWHEAGTKLHKQNVFDDFIAGAEYLIREKYTNPSRLAISGRSNGGLLVGACMTQRPDLFKVALPTVGVMDMLRYHLFTIGWAWKSDYGSSEDEANFKNLYSYSPIHNIRDGVRYPATLVATGDHDDRVVPAHSFKFIATLQAKQKGPNPVLIRVDTNAGHAAASALGSSKPVSKQIDEQTDIFSFLMYNLGMKVK